MSPSDDAYPLSPGRALLWRNLAFAELDANNCDAAAECLAIAVRLAPEASQLLSLRQEVSESCPVEGHTPLQESTGGE